jgi:hypothetical protein
MRNPLFKTVLLACGMIMAQPALAGYKLMPAKQPVAVAKSGLTVTPPIDFNKHGTRIGRYAESWTLDGLLLNDVTFYAGIADGKPLFREANKQTEPLPHFSTTMLAPDIVQMFEASYRVALHTSLMTIDSVEPATFCGTQGVRFSYTFTVQGDDVKRRGEARGAIINGALYMITYEAPRIHYFDRDLGSFKKIAESAVIKAVKK